MTKKYDHGEFLLGNSDEGNDSWKLVSAETIEVFRICKAA